MRVVKFDEEAKAQFERRRAAPLKATSPSSAHHRRGTERRASTFPFRWEKRVTRTCASDRLAACAFKYCGAAELLPTASS
jgi:hypothetical protein